MLVTIYLNQTTGGLLIDGENNDDFINLFLLATNILAAGGILGGIIVFSKKINKITPSQLTEKLTKYREAMIIRDATIEGAAFFFIVGFMITGSSIFLIEAIVVLVLLIFFFPTNIRIANEMNHDIREIEKI